jgi:hypothetical protein
MGRVVLDRESDEVGIIDEVGRRAAAFARQRTSIVAS